MRRRVFVTGIGLVTPLAVGREHTWARLLAGHVSAGEIESFDASSLPVRVACHVPRTTSSPSRVAGLARSALLDPSQHPGLPLFIQFALTAAAEALADADFRVQTHNQRTRTGVSIGVGMASLHDIADASRTMDASLRGFRRVSPHFVPRILTNMAAGHVAIANSLQGPNIAPATACAAGAHAIGDAARIIAHGDADAMLAGGTEAAIHPIAIAGFARARALATNFNDAPSAASRPFDRRRDGFVMGEGAGVLFLESEDHARARGISHAYAEVSGYGMAGDAFHITAPPDDGTGAILAMNAALRDARVRAEHIGYVNAHATSTARGDAVELSAIENIMLDRRKLGTSPVWVSSSKGALGHLLGAAGAVEAAITAMAVSRSRIPPSVNLDAPDTLGEVTQFVPCDSFGVDEPVEHAMSNSFGFGGTNAALLLSRVAL